MHGCVKVIKYEKDAVKQSDLQLAKDVVGRLKGTTPLADAGAKDDAGDGAL